MTVTRLLMDRTRVRTDGRVLVLFSSQCIQRGVVHLHRAWRQATMGKLDGNLVALKDLYYA